MRPLRRHVAIAIDGGGLRGIVVTRALQLLEAHLGRPAPEIFRLAAGTSTGSIISAGIAAGLSADAMHGLYCRLGESIFRRTMRARLWPLTRYRYPLEPLLEALRGALGDLTMGDLWQSDSRHDLVITAFDLVSNHTRFIKPWKTQYLDWPLAEAVAASCAVPTYFPPLHDRYVDGGVGSYTNPCYLAAYEIAFCTNWAPRDTTLISLGTGRSPHGITPGQVSRYHAWDWIAPVVGAFLQSADDQQVHLVNTFFSDLDFRRFQVDLAEDIPLDDIGHQTELERYGEILWHMILDDRTDPILELEAGHLLDREDD